MRVFSRIEGLASTVGVQSKDQLGQAPATMASSVETDTGYGYFADCKSIRTIHLQNYRSSPNIPRFSQPCFVTRICYSRAFGLTAHDA
jgi:hypothetical protein